MKRFGTTNIVGLCDDGELKYTVEWLWEDSKERMYERIVQRAKEISEEMFKEAAKEDFNKKMSWEHPVALMVRISPKPDQIKIEMRMDG